MKKLLSVLMATLALNFLAIGGGVGYLFQTGKLDKAKIAKIRETIFAAQASDSTTRPSGGASDATGQSSANLSNMLAKQGGKSAIEQIDFIRRTFDAQMLEIDRRQRELTDLQRQVNMGNQKLAADRATLDKREKDLVAREQEAQRLQSDSGFQSSLALYTAMPARQVKTIFMTLGDDTVQQYLQAMDTRTAGKIIKEFKSPDETAFIQKVLERIRQSQISATDGKQS